MLTLYDSKTTSFLNLGFGVLKDFYSDPIITEVLNAEYNLEFSYLREGNLSEYLLEGNIIKANSQLFRIWDIKKDLSKITILAKHIFFDLQKNFLEDVAPTNLSASNALSWILGKTEEKNNFNVSGDCSSVNSARYIRKNPIDAIYNEDNAILKKFGGEIELNNFNVILHSKRGNDSGFIIRYGKNLSGISYELDFSTIATRIMPQGKNELLIPEKYIDSPLINSYPFVFYKKLDFDIGIDSENNIDEETAYNLLREEVNKLYKSGIDKPTISIKIDFIELSKTSEYNKYKNLETIHLGDTVKTIIPNLNINIETRVVKTIYNCNLERITGLELGSVSKNISTSQSQDVSSLNNKISNIPNSILSQAKIDATNLINHPFGGYLYISEETGELMIMDTNDPTTAQKVWKWGLGGLGYSSTGINGLYGVAITSDGKINADFVLTGTLAANRIEGYEELMLNVNKIVTLEHEVINNNYLYIESAIKGRLLNLTIEGPLSLLYPSDNLYPSDDLYPLDSYLIIDKTRNLSDNAVKIHLPITVLETGDKFIIENGKSRIEKTDGSTEILEDIEIELFDGENYIYLESFQDDDIKLYAKYIIKNDYTDKLASKVEMNNAITQTNERTDIELSKKVGNEEIIARINMSTEKSEDGSYLGIEADKLNFKGKSFNLTADDIKIIGEKLNIGSNGIIELSDNGVKNPSDVNPSYIVKSDYEEEYEGQKSILVSKHEVTSLGRKVEYDSDNQIETSTGFGHLKGCISEGVYKYPSTYWRFENVDTGYSVETDVGYYSITTPILTQTSIATQKKNFEKLINALEIISKCDIYKYHFKFENNKDKKHIGLIIGKNFNTAEELISNKGDSIDTYSLAAICLQAIKEQQEEIESLKKQIENLKEMIINAQ